MRRTLTLTLLAVLLAAASAQASIWDATGAGTFYNDDIYELDLTSLGLVDGTNYQFSLTFTPQSDQSGDVWEDSGTWEDVLNFQVVDSSGAVQESVAYSDVAGAGSAFTRTLTFNYTSGTDAKLWAFLEASADNTVENWVHDSASLTGTPLPGALWLLAAGLFGLLGLRRRKLS